MVWDQPDIHKCIVFRTDSEIRAAEGWKRSREVGTGYWVLGTWYWVLGTGYRVPADCEDFREFVLDLRESA